VRQILVTRASVASGRFDLTLTTLATMSTFSLANNDSTFSCRFTRGRDFSHRRSSGAFLIGRVCLLALFAGVAWRPALASASVPSTSGEPIIAATAIGTASNAAIQQNLADFDFVVDKTQRNYAGWDTKTAGKKRAEIDALTTVTRAQLSSAVSDSEFRRALGAWIAWFKDGHFYAQWSPPVDGAQERPWPAFRRDLSEADARKQLAALGKKRNAVEGFWRISDSYVLAVLRDTSVANRFDAIVLRTTAEGWKAGDVKALLVEESPGRFQLRYGTGPRTEAVLQARLNSRNDILDTQSSYGVWHRVYDDPKAQRAASHRSPSSEPLFSRVDDSTVYLRAPSFALDAQPALHSLIEKHRAEIEQSAQLIIDVRQNGGGGDSSYAPLLPFLYTRPIYNIGVEYRASPDNIRAFQDIAGMLRASQPKIADEIDRIVSTMRAATTPFVQETSRGFSITRMDQLGAAPRRVAVLIDGAASAAENFILAARQSRKVLLMGQANSAGVIDFAEVVSMPAPSERFRLAWATTRSLRLPHDPVDALGGIAPDIRIPSDADDPVVWAARALRDSR
jgi:hypothetical protein